jgi:orotate phosphoribosyltransferase
VLGVYAEKQGDGFVIRRGYDQLGRSKKILVVEDILNTGGSVRKVVDAVRALPADVVGVAALCNRGGVKSKDLGNVPQVFALMDISLEAWEPEDCPLCKKGMPINTQVGKGIRTA